MRRYARYLLAQALLLGLIPGFSTAQEVTCPTVEAPDVAFEPIQFIDTARAGGEPVSVVAQDGSISVSAHAGTTHIYKNPNAAPGAGDFAVGYFNQTLNWRSTDAGKTWKYIGLAGTEAGPHSATSTGFSDPDFAIDQAGNIYNTEIDLANVAVFKSPDDGQSYPIATPEAASGDRPWLAALEEDEVFLYVNLPPTMWGSTNGGVTWLPLPSPGIDSKPLTDPLNPNDGLIGPSGHGSFGITADDARTWDQRDFGPIGPTKSFFNSIAVDAVGNVYQAGAAGYNGAGDRTASGQVTFAYYERATGATNPSEIPLTTPQGDAMWPWLAAGDDGRVAVVWYQTIKSDGSNNSNFYIYAAVTHNGHGTTVTCDDGTTSFIPPQFTVGNVSVRPIHTGQICTTGTSCNYPQPLGPGTDWEGGDRRLGDFFTVNFDTYGDLFIVSGDTTLKNPQGGPKPVGNPIIIRQAAGGDRMLEEPMKTRPSRCLFPLPSC